MTHPMVAVVERNGLCEGYLCVKKGMKLLLRVSKLRGEVIVMMVELTAQSDCLNLGMC